MDDPQKDNEDCSLDRPNKKGKGSKSRDSNYGRRSNDDHTLAYPNHQYNYHRRDETSGAEETDAAAEQSPKCTGLSGFEKVELEELRERIRSEELSRCLPDDLKKLERGKHVPEAGCPARGTTTVPSGLKDAHQKKHTAPGEPTDKARKVESEEEGEPETLLGEGEPVDPESDINISGGSAIDVTAPVPAPRTPSPGATKSARKLKGKSSRKKSK